MRHAYPCHASPDVLGLDRAPARNGARYRLDLDLLDTARCPCCRAPLVARMGREGPYFHCRCRERNNAGSLSCFGRY
ncbi:MAG TPA: hypothetical protein VE999_14975 [Gemmataceae bacterium]|nr:hypothetical protein [Gemmataceae bacterium]